MNPGPGSGYTGYPKPGPEPGFIRVIKTHSGSRFFSSPVRVQPGPDYPGSSGSGPGPGYFAIPISNTNLNVFEFRFSKHTIYVNRRQLHAHEGHSRRIH